MLEIAGKRGVYPLFRFIVLKILSRSVTVKNKYLWDILYGVDYGIVFLANLTEGVFKDDYLVVRLTLWNFLLVLSCWGGSRRFGRILWTGIISTDDAVVL